MSSRVLLLAYGRHVMASLRQGVLMLHIDVAAAQVLGPWS